MIAIIAVPEEPGFTAVGTVLRIFQIVASLAIDDAITFFRIVDEKRIYAITTSGYSFPIETIFRLKASESQVTILVVAGEIGVIRIY